MFAAEARTVGFWGAEEQLRPIDRHNMPAKSRFTRLDAFTKTVEDARVRTTSGGIVTIASLLIVLYLVWGEWADYRRVVVLPELIVDKGRGKRLTCHLPKPMLIDYT